MAPKGRVIKWLAQTSLVVTMTCYTFATNRCRTKEEMRRESSEMKLRRDGTEPGSEAKSHGLFGSTEFPKSLHLAILTWFSLNFLKNTLLVLLNLDFFRPLRWLDCFLLGRLYVDGPSALVAKYFSMTSDAFVILRVVLALCARVRFVMRPIEFVLADYNQVLLREAIGDRKSQAGLVQDDDDEPPPCASEDDLFLFENPSDRSTRALRPNRTARCWLELHRFCRIYFCSISLLLILAAPTGLIIYGSLLSQRGFELSYGNCIDYITRSRLAANGSHLLPSLYERIYVPSKSLEQLALERRQVPVVLLADWADRADFTSGYHLLRLLFDLIETSLTIVVASLSLVFDTWMALVHVVDLRRYLAEIEKELQSCLLWQRRCNHLTPRKISNLQALLMDYFRTLGLYNLYVSFFTLFILSIWIALTIVSCLLMLNPRGTTADVKYEVSIVALILSLYFVTVVGSFAATRNRMRRIYSLLASNMALDRNTRVTKDGWIMFLKYFYPVPLHCFSILGSIEISWLLCLKVSLPSQSEPQ